MGTDSVVRALALAMLPAAAVTAWLLRAEPSTRPPPASTASSAERADEVESGDPEGVGAGSLEAEGTLASGKHSKRRHHHASVESWLARDLPVATGARHSAPSPAARAVRGRIEIETLPSDGGATLFDPRIETVSDAKLPRWHVPDIIASAIDKRSETEYRLASRAIDSIFERARDLLSGLHPSPVERGGAVAGLRLDGVPEDSLLGRLGIVEGDLLLDLDGTPCASRATGVDALDAARRARRERVVAHLERDGEPFDLEVLFR